MADGSANYAGKQKLTCQPIDSAAPYLYPPKSPTLATHVHTRLCLLAFRPECAIFSSSIKTREGTRSLGSRHISALSIGLLAVRNFASLFIALLTLQYILSNFIAHDHPSHYALRALALSELFVGRNFYLHTSPK
jgi:hypothetical protein